MRTEPPKNLRVGDVIRACGGAFQSQYGNSLTQAQRRALRDVKECRTAARGGHVLECSSCGHQEMAYNSCRNRHCPTCQGGLQAKWYEKQSRYLLNVEYHHVVFTLPSEVHTLAQTHPVLLYGALFEASQEAIREVAADPKHLGAQVGLLLVLHTWGQALTFHPHVHGIVTGGGLGCERNGRVEEPARWVSCRRGFFLPVRVLSRVFRGKWLALMEKAYREGRLEPFGTASAFEAWVQQLRKTEWVVYSQAPMAGPEVVLKYLARYTHRVAIRNGRLEKLEAGKVTFRYKDYRKQGVEKRMALSGVEFLRRWISHVLPQGFVRIRSYGLLSNRQREEKLSVCRRLLLGLTMMVLLLGGGKGWGEAKKPKVRRCGECGNTTWLVVEGWGATSVRKALDVEGVWNSS